MENYKDIHIEQDFWNDFILEASEHIENIETGLITLEKTPDDTEIIHSLFRAFHTIKGLSGFVEHTVIQDIAHKTESLMDFCRKGELKINSRIINAILKSSDYIKRLCEDVDSYKDDSFIAQIEELISELEILAQKETSSDTVSTENSKTVSNQEEGLQAFSNEISKIEESQKAEVQNEELKEPNKENSQEKSVEQKEEKLSENIIKKEEPSLSEKEKTKTEPNEKSSIPKQFVANEEYMKVANYKIDHLVDMIGELIINQSLIEQYISSNYSQDNKLITNMSGFLRITRELQSLSMSLRMVALKPTFQKLNRIARDTIQELNKDIEFVISGENTEIDRVVVDKLLDPLVHMIKNAISHGIEDTPQERIKLGKSPKARVELNAYNKRGKIYIEVKDDGQGLNNEIIYQKAMEKGLIDKSKTYTEEEIREFIMLPGFSTAKVVNNISGRGVGMDVVKTQILKIGGKIDIESIINEGSIFTLEVPVNHAIMNGTVIEMYNNQHFIIPTINVKEILQPEEKQWIFTQQKRTMIMVRGDIIPIIPVSSLFKEKEEAENPLVMILELDDELRALPIKNVINRQEVVVKPVSEEFANLKFISGMSILGTGKVSLILDIDYLFKKEVKE